MRRSACVLSIRATWTLCGNSLLANSAKARENIVSSGICPTTSQPHRRRRTTSTRRRSINARVWGKLNTAFARNARAILARSCGGRPRPCRTVTKPSISNIARARTNRSCRSLIGPNSSRKAGNSWSCRIAPNDCVRNCSKLFMGAAFSKGILFRHKYSIGNQPLLKTFCALSVKSVLTRSLDNFASPSEARQDPY